MDYIRLIAKPDTWYKAGTEVFWEPYPEPARRMTQVEWEQHSRPEMAGLGCVGVRVTEDPASEGGGKIGEERVDGEWCSADEFEVLPVDGPLLCPL